jgi:hypothetical protein
VNDPKRTFGISGLRRYRPVFGKRSLFPICSYRPGGAVRI